MNIGVKESKLKTKIQGISELSAGKPTLGMDRLEATESLRSEDANDGDTTGSTSSIGAMLLAARLKSGEDIASIASHLRIRPEYLTALEQGQADQLPGMTYAIGYVRTYSRHLGLDSDRAVEIYKEETEDIAAKTQLVFPSPAPEGKVPGGTMMAISVVLAIAVYGGWYYLSSNEISLASIIPSIPGEQTAGQNDGQSLSPVQPTVSQAPVEMTAPATSDSRGGSDEVVSLPDTPVQTPAPVVEDMPKTADEAASETVAANIDTSEETSAPKADESSTAEVSDPNPAAVSEQPVKAAVESTMTVAEAPTENQQAADAPNVAASVESDQTMVEASDTTSFPVAAPEEADEVTVIAETVEDQATPDPSPTTVAVAAASEAPAPTRQADEASAEIPDAPDVASLAISSAHADAPATGALDSGPGIDTVGRIVIRAVDDSWVQVRDQQSRPIMTRVMRAGEEFAVPDQPGLELFTGNAGALNILVDGEGTPSIGPFGKVVRHVRLDAELLKNGLAVN